MNRAIVLALLLACRAAPPEPLRTPQPYPHVPPISADQLVHRVFAALEAGDIDEVVRLGVVTAPSLACAGPEVRHMPDQARDAIAELVHAIASEHAELSVLAIEDQPMSAVVRAGRGEACDQIPVVSHDLFVSVREKVNGRELSRPSRAQILAFVVDAQWFLTVQPIVPVRSAVFREDWLAKAHELADQMCACKDAACATAVDRAYAEWHAQIPPDFPDLPERQTEQQDDREASEQAARADQCKHAIPSP